MSAILILIGLFVAAKVAGLVLASFVRHDILLDELEFSPELILACLFGAIKNASAIGALVGVVVFHQEIFAMAKTAIGWPA